jgi:hypothetical protein
MAKWGAKAQVAGEIYHNNFENVHQVCENFQKLNKLDSVNKIMVLLSQLHNASGAEYIYGANGSEPEIWLMSNGKTVLKELISDAKGNNMATIVASLEKICAELEGGQLV